MLRKSLLSVLIIAIAPVVYAGAQTAHPNGSSPDKTTEAKVLSAPEAAKSLPDMVFFRGQSSPIQARNAGGVQFSKDALLLATRVDTSGYSSAVQEKYQLYLITESPITINGHRLEPGAYGCGFLANDVFLVMDIGGHDLFSVSSAKDSNLRRPTPLQVLSSPDRAGYRLYIGRDYVQFAQAATP